MTAPEADDHGRIKLELVSGKVAFVEPASVTCVNIHLDKGNEQGVYLLSCDKHTKIMNYKDNGHVSNDEEPYVIHPLLEEIDEDGQS